MATEYLNNKKFEETIIKFQISKKNIIKYELFLEDLRGAKKRGRTDLEEKLTSFSLLYNQAISDNKMLQEELARSFLLLSENIVRYAKFKLIDMYDAIQEGVLVCFEKIDRFDKNKGRAFNYCSTVIINTLRQLYRNAKTHNELKKRFLEFSKIMNQDIPATPIRYKKSQNFEKK